MMLESKVAADDILRMVGANAAELLGLKGSAPDIPVGARTVTGPGPRGGLQRDRGVARCHCRQDEGDDCGLYLQRGGSR
jgi:hypothetical protein